LQAGCALPKVVEQFHYLQWPDHDVPRNPSQLLCLVEMVNKSGSESPTGPVLVHCRYWDGSALVLEQGWPGLYQPLSCVLSAGIGRTGTFIALDFLLKMARYRQIFLGTFQGKLSRRIIMDMIIIMYRMYTECI